VGGVQVEGVDLLHALGGLGGAANRPRLRELGVSDRALRTGLAAGDVVRVGRAGYALPGACEGLVAAVALGGVASHGTAAALHGLELWTPPPGPHVTIPLGSRRTADGVRVHRANLTAAEVDPGRAITAPLRTLVDCGRTLPLLEAVVILDSALRARVVAPERLRRAAEAARGHGAAALRRAVGYADELAGSKLETALRLLLDMTDARVRTQVRIEGVGTVDFVLDDRIVVEADGFEYHCDRAAYRDDRRRANALAERGYVLLRFTWEDVRYRPRWVLQQVERVRAAGRGRA
jgi:very-short-patch-repair endonuclease